MADSTGFFPAQPRHDQHLGARYRDKDVMPPTVLCFLVLHNVLLPTPETPGPSQQPLPTAVVASGSSPVDSPHRVPHRVKDHLSTWSAR